MPTLIYVLSFILGFLLGVLLLSGKEEAIGTFTINESDPSDELFTIGFEKDLDEFKNKEVVTFRVLKK